MDNGKEHRNNARFSHEATILIEDVPDGTYYHGKMVNYSDNGMGFESQVVHEPGAPIIFSIENSPYLTCPGVYHGQIKWCHQLPETESLYNFGMGVEYFKPGFLSSAKSESCASQSYTPPSSPPDDKPAQILENEIDIEEMLKNLPNLQESVQKDDKELRKHARRAFDRPVLYATRNRFFKGTIKDISKGGVFIEAPDMMAVGQRLSLAIPSGRQGRGLKLRGEIVRIDQEGLAIRFRSVIKN